MLKLTKAICRLMYFCRWIVASLIHNPHRLIHMYLSTPVFRLVETHFVVSAIVNSKS